MLKKEVKIKYFDKEFCPMVPPVISGTEYIDNIEPDKYPLYVAPYIDGVDLVVRHGVVFETTTGKIVRSMYFNTNFAAVIELSRKFHYTIHTTLKSDRYSNDKLLEEIIAYPMLVGDDVKMYITDVVMDIYYNKMNLLSRIGNLNIMNNFIRSNKVEIVIPQIALGKKDVYLYIDGYALSNKHFVGVTLYKDKGEYKQGFVDLDQTDVVSIDLTSKYTYRIVEFESGYEEIGGNRVPVAHTVIAQNPSGTGVVKLSLEKYPVVIRRHMYLNQLNFRFREVIFSALDIPSFKLPSYRTLIKIK